MAPNSIVKELVALAGNCKPTHMRRGTYSAVDALMEASFPLKVGDFTIESSLSSSLKSELACLPHGETISSTYLDMCAIYVLLSSGTLPQNMVLTTSFDAYTQQQAISICDYYLSVTCATSPSTAIIIQPSEQGWKVIHGHRAVGYITYLENFDLEYLAQELATKIEEADVSGRCLAINHNTADDRSYEMLDNICVLKWYVGSDPNCIPALGGARSQFCETILPVYKPPYSNYVRMLLEGGPLAAHYPKVSRMLGDTSFYTRYIRGAKMRSGRCWDCECLYTLAVRLNVELRNKQPGNYITDLSSEPCTFDVEVLSEVEL
jgi:hypothetical protein